MTRSSPAIHYFFVLSKESLLTALCNTTNETLTYEECCSKSALPYFVQCFGLYIVLMITLDRCVSVMAPFFYKTSCTVLRFSLPMVVSAFALTSLEVIVMLINAKNQPLHSVESFASSNPCGTASCWKPNDRYVLTLIFHLILSSIIILINSFLFLHILYSTLKFQHLLHAEQRPEVYRKTTDDSAIVDEKTNLQSEKNLNSKPRRKRNNHHLNLRNLGAVHGKIIKSLLLMIIVHVVSHFSARLILLINVLRLTVAAGNGANGSASAQDPEGNWVAMYARSLVVINGAVHFFLYYNINGRFREASDSIPISKKPARPKTTEQNGMQSTERNRTKEKSSFRSVTVGRFPQNFSYPFRAKVDFQAERFKLLTIRSVPSKKGKPQLLSLKAEVENGFGAGRLGGMAGTVAPSTETEHTRKT
uniref:G-protein coupled receptors family 1 profile domain-containing protein n=1 Tax=Romanomermis culicivorax TaxID=13658 RepID=A0A915J0R8_ROMCU